MKYDSWVSRSFLGEADDTTIFRIDKNLRWTLFKDDDSKKYLECPLGGCALTSLLQFDNKQDNTNEDQFDYDPDDEDNCPVQLTKNTFKLRRRVNNVLYLAMTLRNTALTGLWSIKMIKAVSTLIS